MTKVTLLTVTFDSVVFLTITITITITITFLTITFDRVLFLSPRKAEDHLQERWKPITDMHLGKV